MGASKDRKGNPTMHVHSITEAMGMGGKITVGDPKPPKLVRQVAGQGAGGKGSGTKGAATPFKTKHKGAEWDGPKPRVALPKKYSPKGKS